MHLQSHNLTAKNAVLEAKLNNVDKQTKGLMGFESPSRTIQTDKFQWTEMRSPNTPLYFKR
jgi:hypothetical protein